MPRGHRGQTWRAYHHTLGRDVAVKIVPRALPDGEGAVALRPIVFAAPLRSEPSQSELDPSMLRAARASIAPQDLGSGALPPFPDDEGPGRCGRRARERGMSEGQAPRTMGQPQVRVFALALPAIVYLLLISLQ